MNKTLKIIRQKDTDSNIYNITAYQLLTNEVGEHIKSKDDI